MFDNLSDPLDPIADPPDNQPGGSSSGSTIAPTPSSDPPDDQSGGTT